jgi:dTDP-L-rhamnose 4-epimerase
MLHLVGSLYDIPVTTLRCFNVYGPRQSLSNPYTGVTAIFISRLKNNQPPIVYEDGGQTRDFVSVHDVVDALIQAMDSKAANYQVCNIGTGTPTSIKGIALILAELMGKKIKPLISQKPRKNDIRHCYPDIRQAQKLLKWKPKITLEQGLQELVEWSINEKATDTFALASQELQQKGIM